MNHSFLAQMLATRRISNLHSPVPGTLLQLRTMFRVILLCFGALLRLFRRRG